jgi:hypothetical protein
MMKALTVAVALGLLLAFAPPFAVPALAQKKSCQEVCLKTCETANSKNFCMQKCVPNCNMKRSGS